MAGCTSTASAHPAQSTCSARASSGHRSTATDVPPGASSATAVTNRSALAVTTTRTSTPGGRTRCSQRSQYGASDAATEPVTTSSSLRTPSPSTGANMSPRGSAIPAGPPHEGPVSRQRQQFHANVRVVEQMKRRSADRQDDHTIFGQP